jgi:electron transport complex protein RnfG
MAKKESTLVNMVMTLFIITAIAGVALGFVYRATVGPIETAKQAKIEEAIHTVLPEFEKLEPKKGVNVLPEGKTDSLTLYNAYKGDEYIGTAVKTYTDRGFGGRFWIMIGFLPDGTIFNTAILEHKETPGLGDKMDITKSDFSVQFKDKNPSSYKLKVSKDGGDVKAITAATISSRAFCDATQRAYDIFINNKVGGAE